jgi:glycosyltransferase involved in cell wall biosynthesis
MSESVLLLAPSRGLGGGIERYVATIEAALRHHGVQHHRLDLTSPGRPASGWSRLRFVREVVRAVRLSDHPVRLILAHRNLLPVIYPAARLANFRGATVIVHGCEIWSHRRFRAHGALRHRTVRVVAVSNFSAGALVPTCHANVLYPGVAADWYATLVDAGERAGHATGVVNLVTAFRLQDWREKGLETITEAVRVLGDDRVRLTICGTGPVPPALAAAARHPWCEIRPDLTDRALADCLAGADLFVLATRTRTGPAAHGEGFGLVLLEAQLAGTPVVAPAYGGSGEAFQAGLTGLAPIDETPAALAAVLGGLVDDDHRRAELGRAAAAWSRARFEPTRHRELVIRTLLDRAPSGREVPCLPQAS